MIVAMVRPPIHLVGSFVGTADYSRIYEILALNIDLDYSSLFPWPVASHTFVF